MQQRARGNKARPRDLAKPTEQHMARPKNSLTTREEERSELEWAEEGRDGVEKGREGSEQLGSQETKTSDESPVCVCVLRACVCTCVCVRVGQSVRLE